MKKIRIFVTIICVECLAILILLCLYNFVSPGFSSDMKADDGFSRCVKKSIEKTFYYRGHSDSADDVTYYHFEIRDYSPESVSAFCEALNTNTQLLKGKTVVQVEVRITGTLWGGLFRLSNYCDDEGEEVIYDGFYRLAIWDDPKLFVMIKKIKYLVIDDKMQEKAVEEGIDWYEIWPDLEEVIVYETDERGMRIE